MAMITYHEGYQVIDSSYSNELSLCDVSEVIDYGENFSPYKERLKFSRCGSYSVSLMFIPN
jgi:hypothetical protein